MCFVMLIIVLFKKSECAHIIFTGVRAGQPVTHMSSTNSKPQPSNQFPMDKIKLREAFSLGYTIL